MSGVSDGTPSRSILGSHPKLTEQKNYISNAVNCSNRSIASLVRSTSAPLESSLKEEILTLETQFAAAGQFPRFERLERFEHIERLIPIQPTKPIELAFAALGRSSFGSKPIQPIKLIEPIEPDFIASSPAKRGAPPPSSVALLKRSECCALLRIESSENVSSKIR